MACDCFKRVNNQMKTRIAEKLGADIHTLDEADFAHSVLIFEKGDYCRVMLPYKIRYYRRKKNGAAESRLTNADTSITINYCPFCGIKFEGKAEADDNA